MFANNLKLMLAPAFSTSSHDISIIKTIASQKEGVDELKKKILELRSSVNNERKLQLLTEKAFQLIQNKKMKSINKKELMNQIQQQENFNLYQFIQQYS